MSKPITEPIKNSTDRMLFFWRDWEKHLIFLSAFLFTPYTFVWIKLFQSKRILLAELEHFLWITAFAIHAPEKIKIFIVDTVENLLLW